MLKKMALASILLMFFAASPALAEPDTTYYTNPITLQDDSGLKIHLTQVVASDLPLGSYGFTYPSSDYRYYIIYYRTENPTDNAIRWQYDIRFVDSNNTEYKPASEIAGSTIPAKFQSTGAQPVEYAIPRNATGLHLRWYRLDSYLNVIVWENITLAAAAEATPAPTHAVTATPAPATSPTATPKPAPAEGLLPVLAIGIAASGLVLARIEKK